MMKENEEIARWPRLPGLFLFGRGPLSGAGPYGIAAV